MQAKTMTKDFQSSQAKMTKNQNINLAPVKLISTTQVAAPYMLSESEEPRWDLGINFLSNQEQVMAAHNDNAPFNKKARRGGDNSNSGIGQDISEGDSPQDIIYNSDDSVYDDTYQVINKN